MNHIFCLLVVRLNFEIPFKSSEKGRSSNIDWDSYLFITYHLEGVFNSVNHKLNNQNDNSFGVLGDGIFSFEFECCEYPFIYIYLNLSLITLFQCDLKVGHFILIHVYNSSKWEAQGCWTFHLFFSICLVCFIYLNVLILLLYVSMMWAHKFPHEIQSFWIVVIERIIGKKEVTEKLVWNGCDSRAWDSTIQFKRGTANSPCVKWFSMQGSAGCNRITY